MRCSLRHICHHRQTSMAILVVVFSFFLTGVSAATCENKYSLTFKPFSDPGDPSFITSGMKEVTVYPFQSMPPVILYFTLQTGSIDLTLSGTIVQAISTPLLRLGGDTVQLMQGQAIFRALQVQQAPADPNQKYYLQFSISVPSGTGYQTYSLVSPVLKFITNATALPVSLQFANFGLFFRVNQSIEIPANTSLPVFSLQLVDSLGKLASTRSASVTLQYGNGVNGVLVIPSSFNFTGTVDVHDMMLVYTGIGPIPSGILKLTAVVDGGPSTTTLTTGTITLVDPATSSSCSNIYFNSSLSFFRFNNIGNTAVLYTPLPPVVIDCLTSAWTIDQGATGIVITAVTSGAVLTGNAALVIDGRATFSDLTFVSFAPQSVVITFVAMFSGTTSTVIRRVMSGAVTVSKSPIKSRHLAFGTDSSVQEERNTVGGVQPIRMVQGTSIVSIPLLSITLLDSAFQYDYTATGVRLRLSILPSSSAASPPTFADSTQTVVTTIKGVAKIKNVLIQVSSEHLGTSFVLRVTDVEGIRASLDSAAILFVPSAAENFVTSVSQCVNASSTNCDLWLSFVESPLSYVSEIDQSVSTTVGNPMPEVRVYLNDGAGPISGSAVFPSTLMQLYAYSGTVPGVSSDPLGALNVGVWKGNYFSFPCLQLARVPSQLLRMQFGFYSVSQATGALLATAIPTIRSGFLTVASDTTGNYDIRFVASAASYFTYSGEEGNAVVGVAFPSIQIQIVDSLGNPDSSGVGLAVGASSSSGTVVMDGDVVPFVNGVATLTTLRFLTRVNNPTITFTVQQTSTYAVSRKSLTTGSILVSQLPITAAYLAIVSPNICTSNPATLCASYPFQKMTFATFAAVRIETLLQVFDNCNEPTVVASNTSSSYSTSTISIIQESDEGILDSSTATLSITAAPITGKFRFVTTLIGLSAKRNANDVPIYVRFTVTESRDSPRLIGSQVTIGPIVVTSLATSANTAVCSNAVTARVVVVKLYDSLAQVQAPAYLPQFLKSLTTLMGVETARVSVVGSPTIATGVNTDTVRWQGTRIALQFTDPSLTSSNRDSASSLAAALVNLRPDCQAPQLKIASIYYASNEVSCVQSTFLTAIQTAATCARQGYYSACQCYQDNVIAPMGVVCSLDVTVNAAFQTMCQQLSDCQQSEIVNVCAAVLTNTGNRYIWAFGAFGGFVGFCILTFVGVKKILFRPPAVRLNKD